MNLNPFSSEMVVLKTALSPEACTGRLELLLSRGFNPFATSPLLGDTRADGFSVRLRRTGARGASIHARGRYEPISSGTKVVLRLGLSRGEMVTAIIFMAILVMCGWASLRVERTANGLTMDPAGIPMAIIFVMFLPLGMLLTRWIARAQPAELVSIIMGALEAQPAAELTAVE